MTRSHTINVVVPFATTDMISICLNLMLVTTKQSTYSYIKETTSFGHFKNLINQL